MANLTCRDIIRELCEYDSDSNAFFYVKDKDGKEMVLKGNFITQINVKSEYSNVKKAVPCIVLSEEE